MIHSPDKKGRIENYFHFWRVVHVCYTALWLQGKVAKNWCRALGNSYRRVGPPRLKIRNVVFLFFRISTGGASGKLFLLPYTPEGATESEGRIRRYACVFLYPFLLCVFFRSTPIVAMQVLLFFSSPL